MVKKNALMAGLICLNCGLAFAQEPSILVQLLDTQASLVSIESEISGWFKKPGSDVAMDPTRQRLLVRQNIARASYRRSGAGVIVHASGVIVTNAHNVNNSQRITVVFSNQERVPARIVTLVGHLDLALLKISPPFALQAVPIADSSQIALGDEIITVGNSPLLKQTISAGKVIGLGSVRDSKDQQTELIQTTLNLYKGDSGGPLFNRKGHLVGLLTASETASDRSSFAIPSHQILFYLQEYLKKSSTETK